MSTVSKSFLDVCVDRVVYKIEPSSPKKFFCSLTEKIEISNGFGNYKHNMKFELKYSNHDFPNIVENHQINPYNGHLWPRYLVELVRKLNECPLIKDNYDIRPEIMYSKDKTCDIQLKFLLKINQ